MTNSLLHRLGHWAQARSYHRFRRALGRVEATQRERLHRILATSCRTTYGRRLGVDPGWSWEDFTSRAPVSRYDDYERWIDEQRHDATIPHVGVDCFRFEPTSGTTSDRKWIPYTTALRDEFDAAASAWLHDVGRRHPRVLAGRHYWSLSWHPDELRRVNAGNDDLELLSPVRRAFLRRVMAVPRGTACLSSSRQARLATLVHLAACRDLSLVSVWSPTYLLRLLDQLARDREAVAEILEGRHWNDDIAWKPPLASRAAALLRSWNGEVNAVFLARLWPELSFVSAWDGASSAAFADELRACFPDVPLQGKGLWATEGVVTIPFEDSKPLALTSHALEFRCLQSGAVLPPWRLRPGQDLQPLLTTGSGFLRYQLDDHVRVVGRLYDTPCLEFVGRLSGVDLVGEKVGAGVAQKILDRLRSEFRVTPVSLLARARRDHPPYYEVLAQGNASDADALGARAEQLLLGLHHYRVARELGQLAPARARVERRALDVYYRLVGRQIAGATKIEPVLQVRAREGAA